MPASPTSRRPGRDGMWSAPMSAPCSTRCRISAMNEIVSEPITAPDRLVIPPTTSMARVVNVSAR